MMNLIGNGVVEPIKKLLQRVLTNENLNIKMVGYQVKFTIQRC